MEKMSYIMRTRGRVDNRNDHEFKSLNKTKRQRELLRVTHENQVNFCFSKLFQGILDSKPCHLKMFKSSVKTVLSSQVVKGVDTVTNFVQINNFEEILCISLLISH